LFDACAGHIYFFALSLIVRFQEQKQRTMGLFESLRGSAQRASVAALPTEIYASLIDDL